jgi:integrase
MDMETDPLLFEFCNERNLSESSVKHYKCALDKYSFFNGKTTTELIKEADIEEEKGIRPKNRKIGKRLKNFRLYLIKNDASPSTIQTYFTKVKTVYRHFGIEIPYIPPAKMPTGRHERYSDIPTIDDIRQVIESTSNLKHKAIVLFMSSSGTARNETTSLTVQDFITATKDYHNSNNIMDVLNELEGQKEVIPIFEIVRAKTNYLYYTCCSPEATLAIVKFLKSRSILENTDKLFDVNNSGLKAIFNRLNDRNRFEKIEGSRINFFHSHALRKFHATTIEDVDLANSLQGRKSNPIKESYFKNNPKRLRERYIPYLNKLMINRVETFSIESEEFKTVKRELDTQKKQNTEMEERMQSMEALMQEMAQELQKQKHSNK